MPAVPPSILPAPVVTRDADAIPVAASRGTDPETAMTEPIHRAVAQIQNLRGVGSALCRKRKPGG